jgi:hypothetical protein
MSENGKYLIGDSFRAKLKSTISKVDSMPLGGTQTRIPTCFQDEADVYQPRKFRAATFSGSWAIGSDKTVTFRDTSISPTTASVRNLIYDLPDQGNIACGVAADGTAWHLVGVRHTTVEVITNVTLGTAGLVFTRASVQVVSTAAVSQVTIGTTACA